MCVGVFFFSFSCVRSISLIFFPSNKRVNVHTMNVTVGVEIHNFYVTLVHYLTLIVAFTCLGVSFSSSLNFGVNLFVSSVQRSKYVI